MKWIILLIVVSAVFVLAINFHSGQQELEGQSDLERFELQATRILEPTSLTSQLQSVEEIALLNDKRVAKLFASVLFDRVRYSWRFADNDGFRFVLSAISVHLHTKMGLPIERGVNRADFDKWWSEQPDHNN